MKYSVTLIYLILKKKKSAFIIQIIRDLIGVVVSITDIHQNISDNIHIILSMIKYEISVLGHQCRTLKLVDLST